MSRRGVGRFVANPFAAAGAAAPAPLSAEAAWAQAQALLPELHECAERRGVPASTGRWQRKYEVYTGLGGVALAYLRAGLFCRDARGDAAAAADLWRRAREVAATCLEAEPRSGEVSFFCGTPGPLAIAGAACSLLGDASQAASHRKALLGWSRAALGHEEDELLFGRAGYLYALLWARQFAGACAAEFEGPLREVAERLVTTGQRRKKEYPDWPLMWHCFDEPYLGAAHGVLGNLAMLQRCRGLLSSANQGLVEATITRLLSDRFQSGNLPIVLGASRDEHVHWCHGAPGIPGLALASEAGGGGGATRGALRAAALQAGEVVWERGAILKGNGLCHGIAGNGYTFLSLYRLTGDAAQLQRAAAFAALLHHAPLQEAIARQPDPQRRVAGQPDSPRSLMEGSAGVLCFLLDAAAPASAAFPAWEL